MKNLKKLESILVKVREDNVITPKEIDFLQKWFDEHADCKGENGKYVEVIGTLCRVIDNVDLKDGEFDSLIYAVKRLTAE